MTIVARVERGWLAVIAVVAWAAVVWQIALAVEVVVAAGLPWWTGVVNTLSYFTVLTNLLVAVVATASPRPADGSRFLTRPSTMSAVALYILVVGATYSLVLRATWQPTGAQKLVDHALHDVMPVLYLLFWILCVPKGTLRWGHAAWWLIYPAAYFLYAMVRGQLTGLYPYPFIDVSALGFATTLRNAAVMLAVFLVLGLGIVALDRALGRGRR